MSWCAETPFFDEHISRNASAHLFNGTWLRSITVPTVTVKFSLQPLQYRSPGRCDLPCSR